MNIHIKPMLKVVLLARFRYFAGSSIGAMFPRLGTGYTSIPGIGFS